jgi:hypothetical protein
LIGNGRIARYQRRSTPVTKASFSRSDRRHQLNPSEPLVILNQILTKDTRVMIEILQTSGCWKRGYNLLQIFPRPLV